MSGANSTTESGVTDAQAEQMADAEIAAIQAAIEGECDGLAIDKGQACRILLYLAQSRQPSAQGGERGEPTAYRVRQVFPSGNAGPWRYFPMGGPYGELALHPSADEEVEFLYLATPPATSGMKEAKPSQAVVEAAIDAVIISLRDSGHRIHRPIVIKAVTAFLDVWEPK